jgi:hypothetical protein
MNILGLILGVIIGIPLIYGLIIYSYFATGYVTLTLWQWFIPTTLIS